MKRSRMTKQQKRAMYAAAAARSAAHREIDQYEDDNVGTQALSEGEKAAGNVRDISKSRYARKLKKKAKMQGKKGCQNRKIFPARSRLRHKMQAHPAPARAVPTGFHAGNSGKKSVKAHYAAARSGTAAQTAGGKAASNGASCRPVWHGTGRRQRAKPPVSTAVNGHCRMLQRATHTFW